MNSVRCDNSAIDLNTGRIVAPVQRIGQNVRIGSHSIVAGDDVQVGDNVSIGPNTDIRAARVRIGANSEIGPGVNILAAEDFGVDVACRISRNVSILCRSFVAGRLLFLGHELVVGYGGTTEATAVVRIGDRVALGPRNILNANCEIELADQVGSGCDVTFWTHGFHFGHTILDGYAATFEPIRIGSNVWLGFHVTLLPGVSIGENTIVASGALVNKSLPANALAAGVPAKVRGPLDNAPLTASESDAVISDLLAKWAHELKWKGLGTTVRDDCWSITSENSESDPSYRADTMFLREGAEAPTLAPDAPPCILVSVNALPGLAERLRASDTLFELRNGAFSGASTDISEDLRDFLRRHTLPCGDDRLFRSIEPAAFSRIRRLGQS